MKGKKVLPILAIFLAIGMVTALGYYAIANIHLNIFQPIGVDGNLDQTIDCNAGEVCYGDSIIVSNNGDEERTIYISDDNSNEDVVVSYVGFLGLTQKTVDFEIDVWEITEGAETAEVEYTMIGEEFTASVVDGEKENYVLIYYKDNSDRFSNPAQPIFIGDIVGNLPYGTDGNTDEYDYCATGEYDTCHGAKLWYVPIDAIHSGELDWSRADEFLYETFLIQYNADGEIIVYPGSSFEFTPKFEINSYANPGLTSKIGITIA